MFRLCDVKMRSYIKTFNEFEFRSYKIPFSAKFELDLIIILKIIQVSLFFLSREWCNTLKTKACHGNIQFAMVIDKICKMTVKDVRLKSESFFSIYFGVMEKKP